MASSKITCETEVRVDVHLSRQDVIDILNGEEMEFEEGDVSVIISHKPAPLEYLESLPENQPKE